MSLLQEMGGGQGYLKGGFLGFAGSGKTFTAVTLAIGVKKFFKHKGAIAMYDTEGGSEYIAQKVLKETGQKLQGVRSRSFDDLVTVGLECEKAGISVLIADSVTHVWRELCASWLKRVNEARARRNPPLTPRTLEFQDWNGIKEIWNDKWTSWYLNSKIHIIICGRAGFEYDFEKNEETGKSELIKSGIKMKVENEFGFEPSLLVEMERDQEVKDGVRRLVRRATVLKDRFGVIDATVGVNPTFDFFKPHIELLTPGAHAPVDTEVRTNVPPVEDDGWPKEKRDRVILCEEIQGLLLKVFPGQTTREKSQKAAILENIFGTRSWTKVESMQSSTLRAGLGELREAVSKLQAVGAGGGGE